MRIALNEIEEIKGQINEELVQEKFRQILIKNGIADDYVFVQKDDFEFK